MEKPDLSLMLGDIKLNIRVGAILEYNGKILVEKNKKVDFGVITGGRIRTLESGQEALIREIKEELDVDLSKEKFNLQALIENFFEFNNKTYHELYFVYKAELSSDYGIENGFDNKDNDYSKFYWYTTEQFKKQNILPSILKEIIENKEFKNYIVNDLNKK